MAQAKEEWIGYLELDGETRIVKVDGVLAGDGPASFGLPNERIFGLDIEQSTDAGGEITAHVDVLGDALDLRGTCDANLFHAAARMGGRSGRCELRRVAVWELAAYRPLSAEYELASGRRLSVHVNGDEWVGAPVLFYSEGDRFVRLYPDAFGNLISEAAECFVLAPDGGNIESMWPLDGTLVATPTQVVRTGSWIDEPVSIDGPGGRLAGTLMRPSTPGPHPVIVIVHGAAGGRRDYYRAFAEHYVHCGIAALVYDRRGWGESTGNPAPTWQQKADDAGAWVDWLAARPDIHAGRIGVWGFSNGSWVAPMVAVQRPNIAFVSVIGAAGTTPVETEIHRRVFDLQGQDVPDDQVEVIAEMWRLIYDLFLSQRPDSTAKARFDALAARVRESKELAGITVQEYAVQSPFLGAVPPYASYQDVVDDLPNHTADDEWTCDPVDYYEKISVPVLYMVGENDSNLPAMTSANRVSRALQRAGNDRGTVLLFPNTGHAMNPCHPDPIGMNDEEAGYRLHGYRFSAGFLDILRAWATDRAHGA